MRSLYTCIFYVILPFLFIRLYLRGFKNRDFRQRWDERLAIYHQAHEKDVIFFHAVSVGEAESIFPLINRLLEQKPALKILITTTTPTGSARVKAVLGNQVQHVYLPYDMPIFIQHFLNHFKPRLAVIAETEVWANLFALCKENAIPLFIINARLSKSSYAGYQKISALSKPALNNVTLIAAQTQEDADRFAALTGDKNKVQVVGNIKFDLEISEQFIEEGRLLHNTLFPKRFVWIIASTHREEENFFLEIYPALKKQIPQLLLLIVPRNMERFGEVKRLCEKQQLQVVMRTSGQVCTDTTDVYLADTIGELKMLYAAADVAFVGGSLVSVGGHNVLEPAVIGIPVMFGTYMANFKAIATGILAAKAAIQCENQQQLADAILKLYQQPGYREELIANGKRFVQQNQGAIAKIIALLTDEFTLTEARLSGLKD
jgi:3-deoxy-D-manno-octulosonic-acid transferase